MKALHVASSLFTVLALHAGAASAQPTGEAKELARSAYARGVSALERTDYATAANEFLRDAARQRLVGAQELVRRRRVVRVFERAYPARVGAPRELLRFARGLRARDRPV